MRKIKIESELEVMRTSYLQIFCKKIGSKNFLIGINPDTDILLRHPDLATSVDYPDEIIFVPGDIIKLEITYLGKAKDKKSS